MKKSGMKSQNGKLSLGDKFIKAANKSIKTMIEERAAKDQYVVFAEEKKVKKVKAKEVLDKIDL